MQPEIIPAILAPTFAEFAHNLHLVEGLAPYVQIDVMDGEFVNARSFAGRADLLTLHTPARFELHLMVADPLLELKSWADIIHVFRVIFHLEAVADPRPVIQAIRAHGWQVGIALNPETPFAAVEPYLSEIDLVLFLAVTPGAQGQKFMPEVLQKITAGKTHAPHVMIGVDGGINRDTITRAYQAGATICYVGSALLRAPDAGVAHEELKSLLK